MSEKPSQKVEGYETVHSKGSRFGQDLTAAGVEALLKGGGGGSGIDVFGFLETAIRNLPGGIIALVNSIPNLIVGGLAWAADQLWGETKDVPYPTSPSFTAIPEKLREALAPLNKILEDNITQAETATAEAQKINDVMRSAFENGEEYSADLQLNWNKLVNDTDTAQNASLKALQESDEALEKANAATAIAAARSGRICWADRQTRVQDGFVKIDNPAGSSTAYVSIPPKNQLVEEWYGTVTAITQFRDHPPQMRSGWVEKGVLKGSSGNTIDNLNMGGGTRHIEHTIAIYSQMPKAVYDEFRSKTTTVQN